MKKKIFVSGATGAQGGAIATQFISQGDEVVSLSLKNEQPSVSGLKLLKGGFQDVNALEHALENVDAAVYTFPLIFDIELAKKYTTNFIKSAEKQNVPLVVFNAGFDLLKQKSGLLALDLKAEIKQLFDNSDLNVITLIPDIYIDNLAAPWSIPVIFNQGILPYPISSGEKVPWISHVDLAKFVVSAAKQTELIGRELPIGGNLYSGEEIAQAISSHINKPVQFVAVAPDDFEKQLAPNFGDLAAKEISNLYRYVADNKTALAKKSFKTTQEILSTQPQTIEDWVKSVQWNNG